MGEHIQKGLIILYIGNGKGKTTAATGLLLRAWGQNMRVAVLQFLKSGDYNTGEANAAVSLGIEWQILGSGFTWAASDIEHCKQLALQGWEQVKQTILSGQYDLLLLDEFTYLFQFGWLEIDEVISWIRKHKPSELHLVITGRFSPRALITTADLVTEMREIKHPYQEGIYAQKGIEF